MNTIHEYGHEYAYRFAWTVLRSGIAAAPDRRAMPPRILRARVRHVRSIL
jgi:hypothetical protein